jgi:glucose uptake protein
VGIGIALVVGVVLSYIMQPKGNAALLASGVIFAIAAVVMDGKAYAELGASGRAVSKKSIIVCIVSGVLMGLFPPFVTRAMTAGAALGPYSIAVIFTLGALLSCSVINTYFMKRPLVGDSVKFSDFFKASAADHALGILGGAIWGLGTVFNFVAGSYTGVAISYAIGQSAPMVAALWGLFVWKEFVGASKKAHQFLILMFIAYVLAIAFVATSSG